MATRKPEPKHPIQPLVTVDGVQRFKHNAIVRHLLDAGPFDLNSIAVLPFSREDREQFAQLIGYSWSGASELSYVSSDTLAVALAMEKDPMQMELKARVAVLETKLREIAAPLRKVATAMFRVHPDDLQEDFNV